MSSRCSPASADSTKDSEGQATTMSECANPTPTGDRCSSPGSPESPSQTTYETFAWQQGAVDPSHPRPDSLNLFHDISLPLSTSRVPALLISSAAGSPARTSQWPDAAPASTEADPASSTSSPESLTLFNPDGYSSRTYPDCSPRTAVGTSEACLERWPTSGTAWHGGFSTAVTSE